MDIIILETKQFTVDIKDKDYLYDMANHNTASLRAFRQHFYDLETAITPPGNLISRLYAAGLITKGVRDEAYDESRTQRCCYCLLTAVESKISINEAAFDTFLSVLSQDAAMEELCTILRETKGE